MGDFWELTLGLLAVFVGVEVGRMLVAGFINKSASTTVTTGTASS
ncbi:MAG TPA: hypothetical protein VGY31_03440 [Terriglobia bacterium]|nr:hypothetical protein [Terriglobia bacterium]